MKFIAFCISIGYFALVMFNGLVMQSSFLTLILVAFGSVWCTFMYLRIYPKKPSLNPRPDPKWLELAERKLGDIEAAKSLYTGYDHEMELILRDYLR